MFPTPRFISQNGQLAQLVRALLSHGRGHRFRVLYCPFRREVGIVRSPPVCDERLGDCAVYRWQSVLRGVPQLN